MSNPHLQTVSSIRDEWSRFAQSEMSDDDARKVSDDYFAVFPWASLPLNTEGFDMVCGDGRWTRCVAPHVEKLHCAYPSGAIEVVGANLVGLENVTFHRDCRVQFAMMMGAASLVDMRFSEAVPYWRAVGIKRS